MLKSKRVLSLILAIFMLVSMLTCIVLPTASAENTLSVAERFAKIKATDSDNDGVFTPAANVVFVNPSFGTGTFTYKYGDGTTWGNGVTYELTLGENAFKKLQEGIYACRDAWNAHGGTVADYTGPDTVVVCPGTYAGDQWQKTEWVIYNLPSDWDDGAYTDLFTLNVVGPQAGISPVTDGIDHANPTPQNGRSVDTKKEAVSTSTMWEATNAHYIVDGMAFKGAHNFYFRGTSAGVYYAQTFRNIYHQIDVEYQDSNGYTYFRGAGVACNRSFEMNNYYLKYKQINYTKATGNNKLIATRMVMDNFYQDSHEIDYLSDQHKQGFQMHCYLTPYKSQAPGFLGKDVKGSHWEIKNSVVNNTKSNHWMRFYTHDSNYADDANGGTAAMDSLNISYINNLFYNPAQLVRTTYANSKWNGADQATIKDDGGFGDTISFQNGWAFTQQSGMLNFTFSENTIQYTSAALNDRYNGAGGREAKTAGGTFFNINDDTWNKLADTANNKIDWVFKDNTLIVPTPYTLSSKFYLTNTSDAAAKANAHGTHFDASSILVMNQNNEVCTFYQSNHDMKDIYASDKMAGGVREMFGVTNGAQMAIADSQVEIRKSQNNHCPVPGFDGKLMIVPQNNATTHDVKDLFTFRGEGVEIVKLVDTNGTEVTGKVNPKDLDGYKVTAQLKGDKSVCNVTFTISIATDDKYLFIDPTNSVTSYEFNGKTYTLNSSNRVAQFNLAQADAMVNASDATRKKVVVFLPGTHTPGNNQLKSNMALLGPQFGVSPVTDNFTLATGRGITKNAENSYAIDTTKEAVLKNGYWDIYRTEVAVYVDGFVFDNARFNISNATVGVNGWHFAMRGALLGLSINNVFLNGWSSTTVGGFGTSYASQGIKGFLQMKDIYAAGLGKTDYKNIIDTTAINVNLDHMYVENRYTSALFRVQATNGKNLMIHPGQVTFKLKNSKFINMYDNWNFMYPNYVDPMVSSSTWGGTANANSAEYYPAGFKHELDNNIFEDISTTAAYAYRGGAPNNPVGTDFYFTNNTVIDTADTTHGANYYFWTPAAMGKVNDYVIEGNAFINQPKVGGVYIAYKDHDVNLVNLDENFYGKTVGGKDVVQLMSPTLAQHTSKSDWYYLDRALTTKNTEVYLADNGYTSIEHGKFDGINYATIKTAQTGLTAENAFKAISGAEIAGVYADEACTTPITGALTKPNMTLYVMVKKSATGIGCVTKVTMELPCAHAGSKTLKDHVAETCGTDGYKTYTCDDCGREINAWKEILPATNAHVWDSGVVSIAPTCQVMGTTLYTCTAANCLADGSKATKTEQDIAVVPCESDGTWNVVTAPKCEVDGSETQNCKWCGAVLATQAIPQTGHDWDEGYEDPIHDCMHSGTMHYTCKNDSSHTYTAEVPSTGEHNFIPAVKTPATCTTEGVMTYTCYGCNTTHEAAIPVTGHDYVAVTTKEPTCVEDGILTYTCQNCGDSYTTPAPANGSHDYKAEVTVYPTCTTEGVMTYTCQRSDCGEVTTEAIPNLGGHKYGDWILRTASTCAVPGVEYHTCTVCGYEETRNLPLFDHYYSDEFTIDIKPTGTVRGEKSRHCLICTARTDITDLGYCQHENIGKDWIIDMEASCTAPGEKHQVCLDCGDNVNSTEIKQLDHTYVETGVNKEPTCTEKGEMALTCSVCGGTSTKVIAANGHNPGAWVTVTAPTCTTEGLAEQVCLTCDAKVKTKTLSVVDHAELIWVTTTPADCLAEGVSSYVCADCGDVFDEKVIPATGHKATHVDTTPATCTEDGLRDYVCSVCGEENLDVVIAAKGHTEGEWVVVTPATIHGAGLQVKYCTVCGEIVAEEVLEWVVNECDPFTDVVKKSWYHKGVDFVFNSGLMSGISSTKFAPTMATSRGMFVTILGRLSGVDADQYTFAYFEDVKDGSYYFGYIEWARVNGIVAGTGNYVFQPDRAITRQEMCKMIVSYANYEEIELVMNKGKVTFKDDASIAKWAKSDVYTCQRAGIVNGDTNGTFRPTDTASRAEVAVLIMNFWNSCMK